MRLLPRDTSPLCAGDPRGFSILEAIIASGLFLLLISGVATVIGSSRDNYHDATDLIDTQQTARIALEQIQRDLQVAGVGLSRLQPPFAIIVPRVDGGIDMRVNRGQVTTFLVADMASATDTIDVDDVSAFSVGQRVAVYDAAGSIDMTTIDSIDAANDRISHGGLSKAYSPDDGAAVAVVQTITYRTEVSGTTLNLIREVDGANAAVLATNLTGVTFTYFDDATPPAVFTPVSLVDQLSIRVVEVDLMLQTANERLAADGQPTIELTARVTPRSLVLF